MLHFVAPRGSPNLVGLTNSMEVDCKTKSFNLLGIPFGVDLETKDMDEFFIKCLKKKLKYWFLIHLPLVSKTFIISLVLVFSLCFFINV